MKTMVIGAGGGFGGAVARDLVSRGFDTTTLVRPGGRDPSIPGLVQVTGDALDAEAVRRAAAGMDVIVFGFNVPYPLWAKQSLPAVEIVADVAASTGATIVFPGNVYGLGDDFSRPLRETCGRAAPTALGRLRNQMEARLARACERGARVIVLRAGDYFGPGATNTWFEQLTAKARAGGALLDPAAPNVPHAWAYLPDVARAAVELALRRHELERYAEFHFAGYSVTSDQMNEVLCQALGSRRVRRFPWWALKLAAPFWAVGRALLSLRYLWTEPVLLDDTKLRSVLGDTLVTPLAQAVAATLPVVSAADEASEMRRCA
jgi:nucleoside-diphosphate-sugar epimerase